MRHFFFILLILPWISSSSQTCFSLTCTYSISSNSNTDYTLTSGQVFCLDSGIIYTGKLLVQNGIVCNYKGIINTTNFTIDNGSEVFNWGTITADTINILNQSRFYNTNAHLSVKKVNLYNTITNAIPQSLYNYWSSVHIDDLYGLRAYIRSTDSLIIKNNFTIDDGTLVENLGYFEVGNDYYGRAGCILTNSLTAVIKNATNLSSEINNSNSLTITNNLTNKQRIASPDAYSLITNIAYMSIGNRFVNEPTSQFKTNCMVHVYGSFYNSGVGLIQNTNVFSICAGLIVSDTVYNNFGAYVGNVDICDLSPTAPGFEAGNNTTWGGPPTFCACTNNNCMNPIGINELNQVVSTIQLSPNPNNGSFIIIGKEKTAIQIMNSLGQIIKTDELNKENEFKLREENLPAGIYFVVAQTINKQYSKKIIVTN